MTEEAKKPRRRRRTKAAVKAEQAIETFQATEEKIEKVISEEVISEKVVETISEPEPIVEPEPEVAPQVKKQASGPDLSNNKDIYDPSYGLNQVLFGRGRQLWRRRTRRRNP